MNLLFEVVVNCRREAVLPPILCAYSNSGRRSAERSHALFRGLPAEGPHSEFMRYSVAAALTNIRDMAIGLVATKASGVRPLLWAAEHHTTSRLFKLT